MQHKNNNAYVPLVNLWNKVLDIMDVLINA